MFRVSVVDTTLRGNKLGDSKLDMDKEVYTAYHNMHNKSKISIKLTADERAILDVWMHEAGWENLSGFIKYRLFGMDKTTRKRNAIVRKGDAESVSMILLHHLADLVNQFRFWGFAYKAEINKDSGNTDPDISMRLKTLYKKMEIMADRMMGTLYVLLAIAIELKIDVEAFLNDAIWSRVFHTKSLSSRDKHIFLTGKAMNDPELKEDKDGTKSIWVTVESYKESAFPEELCIYNCQLRNTKASVKKGDDVSVYGLFSAPLVNKESGRKTVVFMVTNSIIVKLN